MSKAIFIQNPDSIYDDQPGEAYHFPRMYLRAVEKTIGDWVIFYEGRRGEFGYVSVQRVLRVEPDPLNDGLYYARLDQGSRWSFETTVPRADPQGVAYEVSLRREDGSPMSGGRNTSAVRVISDAEFSAIVNSGLEPIQSADSLERMPAGFAEQQDSFAGLQPRQDRTEMLTSRAARDASFERQVKAAYGGRCAISGLDLRNGGGRPEVQAAHIRPVSDDGPDVVPNGIAMSGTLHWMFDRGLIAISDDYRILVSHNKVPSETAKRLIVPDQRLILPENPRHRPHPKYIRWHREHRYGLSGNPFEANPEP